MKRRQRIENKGYKVAYSMVSGYYFATKSGQVFTGLSITALHKQIFGY